jgi:hypothetical protein
VKLLGDASSGGAVAVLLATEGGGARGVRIAEVKQQVAGLVVVRGTHGDRQGSGRVRDRGIPTSWALAVTL